MKSASYRPATCCPREPCARLGTPGEPCWGEVTPYTVGFARDGSELFGHACQGHWYSLDQGGAYEPEPGAAGGAS